MTATESKIAGLQKNWENKRVRAFAQQQSQNHQNKSAESPVLARSFAERNRDLDSMLRPQLRPRRTLGNPAMQQLPRADRERHEAGPGAASSIRFIHDFSQIALNANVLGKFRPKLAIGTPGDVYEREADRVAELVMQMPEPGFQYGCTGGEGCPDSRAEYTAHDQQDTPLAPRATPPVSRQSPVEEEEKLQKKSAGEAALIQRQPVEGQQEEGIVQTKPSGGQKPVPSVVSEVQLHASECAGQRLSDSTRSYFGPRFGHDFGSVRVHTGDKAVQMNQTLNARAFTYGNHIFFNRDQYSPETYSGKHLLSHELTHVLQQDGNRISRFSCNPSPECCEWGGFRICGSTSFRSTVVSELTTLNGTAQGSGVFSAIETNREPWYRPLIRIEESGACGFLPVQVLYNAAGCGVTHGCPGAGSAWQAVPNRVYLFHEIVHVYEYLIGGRGTHPDRECMATGLGTYFNTIPYNENKLRCELGLPVRPCYDGLCTAHAAPGCSSAGGSSSHRARGSLDCQAAGPAERTAGFMINRESEPAESDGDTAEIIPCPDQEAVHGAVQNAGVIVAAVRRRMASGTGFISEDTRLRRPMHWFYILFFHVEPGDRSMGQIFEIKENFRFLEQALSTVDVQCGTANHPDCRSGDLSHLGFSPVEANSHPTIYLCPGFFNAGEDAQARTIIHELAHARLAAAHAGGRFIHFGCFETPLRSFGEAIDNAYVYDNFAMCLYAASRQP